MNLRSADFHSSEVGQGLLAPRQERQIRKVSAKLLRIYQASCIVLGTAFCVFFACFGAWKSFLGPAVFLVLVAVSIGTSRSGRVVTGAKILSLSLWAGPAWTALMTGGLDSPLLMWFTPHVFMSASMLGWRWAMVAGLASLLSTAAMLPFRGMLVEISEFRPGGSLDILTALCAFTSIALISYYGILFSRSARAVQQKLRDAQVSLARQKFAMDVHSIVAVTDRRGRIIAVNDRFCEISQYPREELIGQTHSIVNSGHHTREFWKEAWATIGGGQVWWGEVKNRCKDGSEYWVETSIVPICDSEGRPEEYIAVRTDITAQKRAEEESLMARDAAESAAAAKANFLATMSHEIRTPMNGVSGMAHLLGETRLTDEQRQYLDALTTSSTALLTLIDDILDYSKIEAGKLEIDLQDFALRAMVEGVDELMSLKAEQKGLRFAAIVDRGVPDELVGDAGRLRQILVNLGNNAVKFTESGFITLRICGVEGQPDISDGYILNFSIQDTGIGMSPGVLEKLFTPFTQADASTTRKFGGTGLGLSISQELCGMMGGRMEVESTPGEGSTFGFTLRLGRGASVSALKLNAPTQVLLLSEAGDCREGVEEGLAFLGASLKVVPQLSSALEDSAVLCEELGTVIYQPSQGATDPTEVVEELVATPTLKGKNIIVVLPIQQLHRSETLREAGADTVLSEPVRLAKLLAALQVTEQQVTPQVEQDLSGHVLLVDDNEINRLIATRLLGRMGLEVTSCVNGQEAVDAVEQGHFDLVLMDCQMPIMDGYEATRYLRKKGSAAPEGKLPIIALTAGVMKADREACFAAGMDDYLAKPISPKKLRSTLEKHLSLSTPGAAAMGDDTEQWT